MYETVQSEIIDVPYFRAEWIRVQTESNFKVSGDKPHVLVIAKGGGRLSAEGSEILLQTQATSFQEFKQTNTCYALIVHAVTQEYIIENSGKEELIILAAYGKG